MDDFYSKRIRGELERIGQCTDHELLGVDSDSDTDTIRRAYEGHLKNLGTDKCGYSPETRNLAKQLFLELKNAAQRLGVPVTEIDQDLGIDSVPPTSQTEEATADAANRTDSFPVILGESSGDGPAAQPVQTNQPQHNNVLPTPAMPVSPLMSAGTGPNASVPMHGAGSPPYPMPLPRAVTPTPAHMFPPGVPLSPGLSPINGAYPPAAGSQAWPALASFPPQMHPSSEALQKRAELAEDQLSQLRKEHEALKVENQQLQGELEEMESSVEGLNKRLKAAERLALMLRQAHAETKAKLQTLENSK
ncbi:MAG: hypothetical protein VYC39_05225 [Myxococcota bacterium]|nr:hypothetical protein [Myxococcota bacterium]